MGFKCGLVGMPNVGKSSIFNLLTKQTIPANNYPFCTIDPNKALVEVPDTRLDKLADINNSEKVINTSIEFVDIAGLIKGASKGEGLGNEFLSHINSTEVIAHVVRFFEDKDIIHVKEKHNPIEDFIDINLELILSDLNTIEKYIANAKKGKKDNKDRSAIINELEDLMSHLSEDKFASSYNFSPHLAEVTDLKLLTNKPMFIIANKNDKTNNDDLLDFKNNIDPNIPLVSIDVKLEEDINELDEDDRKEFLTELGVSDSALNRVIKTGYDLLGLKTFFTSGPKETRAWSAKKEFNARDCSGIIHTDIKKGFIRAETVSYADYIVNNGEQGSKLSGVWRQEGKDYLVKEGDVIYFRFNV